MGQFRVMSWNVENLFDVGDDDGPDTAAQLDTKVATCVNRVGRHPRDSRLRIVSLPHDPSQKKKVTAATR